MQEKTEKIILDIIPLTRIPLGRQQYFSYLGDRELAIGTLVSIPLFRRSVEGIVINNRRDFERLGNIQLKKIYGIYAESFLTAQQLQLAELLSQYYLSPLGIALKHFIPKRVTLRNKPLVEKINKPRSIKVKLTQDQKNAVNLITKKYASYKVQNTKYLLFGPASSGKTEVYIHAIAKNKTRNPASQFLILLPELTLAPQASERYSAYFPAEEIVVLHSKLSPGQFYANWQKIKTGEAKIIIGTRQALFAPFQDLGLIIIDEEQDMSFKQWNMNPRYDARTVAEQLATVNKCNIVFGSATPRIEDYHHALLGKYRLLTLPKLKVSASKNETLPTTIEIVDMRKERWTTAGKTGNFTSLSRKLQAEIAYALRHNAQVILFINRRGVSAFSVCESCKNVLKCPRCERALIYDRQGFYTCLHCKYKTDIFPTCAHCHGTFFRNFGAGTQKIEKELEKLFPTARILRADNDTMSGKKSAADLYAKFSQGCADILIGTQLVTKGWDLPAAILVGIIDADALLSFPDFYAGEKAYQNILQAIGRVGRVGSKFRGTAIIQTFNPFHPILVAAAAGKYSEFYIREISERENLSYPPFSRLIKLTYRHRKNAQVQKEVQKTFQALQGIAQALPLVRVSEPQAPILAKTGQSYNQQIIIRINGQQPEIPPRLRQLLEKLSSHWIIDVDPIAIA